MTDSMTHTRSRRPRAVTAVDLKDLDTTLTLAEWHRYRDTDDSPQVVVPHDQHLQAA